MKEEEKKAVNANPEDSGEDANRTPAQKAEPSAEAPQPETPAGPEETQPSEQPQEKTETPAPDQPAEPGKSEPAQPAAKKRRLPLWGRVLLGIVCVVVVFAGLAVAYINGKLDLTQAEAVIAVHEMFRSPAILQGADLANAFMGGRVDFANGTLEDKKKGARNIAEAVKKFAEQSPIPVVLHLDHGKNFDSCVAAIEGGYTSVMIDGSHYDFEENVRLTKEVADIAHKMGIVVEAELGKVGNAGNAADVNNPDTYTDVQQAVEFVERTGCDSLAIAIGNAHGNYVAKPNLAFDRLRELRAVARGYAGLDPCAFRQAVDEIGKVRQKPRQRIALIALIP